jgi:undecaprenyl-diphosphatase
VTSLAATWAVAADGVPRIEEQTFDVANQSPDWLEQVLWLPMQLGSLFGPVVVAAAAWARWREWRPAVGSLAVGIAAWEGAKLIKDQVGRGRPYAELSDLVIRGGTPLEGGGYVSGHAAVAFGLATVLSPYLSPRGRWVGYGLAGLVGFARVHVGAHLPLDVLGGAAVGYSLGVIWRLVVGAPVDGGYPPSL